MVTTKFAPQYRSRLAKWRKKMVKLSHPLVGSTDSFYDMERGRAGGASHLSGRPSIASTIDRRRSGASTSERTSIPIDGSGTTQEINEKEEEEVDEIVVNRDPLMTAYRSEIAAVALDPGGRGLTPFPSLATGGTLDGAHSEVQTSHNEGLKSSDIDAAEAQFLAQNMPRKNLGCLSGSSLYPRIKKFFQIEFQDQEKEKAFAKESWYLGKQMALITAMFYYFSWALGVALLPKPLGPYDHYCYIGIAGVLTLPLIPLLLYDFPRRNPFTWQVALFLATWTWPFLLVFEIRICGYYFPNNKCGTKDFIGAFFYLVAAPALSLFGLGQSRVFALVGAVLMLIYIGAVLIPIRTSWVKHFFNFLLVHCFLLYISYTKEKTERRIFALRDQLKAQYRATQKAQVAEGRAADSKKRFHEVRVPLNTALLAVQNLVGEEVFKHIDEDQQELVDVLQSSLGMMEKVLNDVLDFNRMESGRLMCTSNPFNFHKVIRSVLLSLRVAASTKQILLCSDLDLQIDSYGELMGDEMRLRQVLGNLASNACKFTEAGGSVNLVTKLLYPGSPPPPTSHVSDQKQSSESLDTSISTANPTLSPSPCNSSHSIRASNHVVIRIEVQDTGVGIRKKDVANDRLFSPYVQTEIGKRQGGKGTGLGLALVRNIIQLSGGKLGVRSKKGLGSTFWVEMIFGIAGDLRNPKQGCMGIGADRIVESVSGRNTVSSDSGLDLDLKEEEKLPIVRIEPSDTSTSTISASGQSDNSTVDTHLTNPATTNDKDRNTDNHGTGTGTANAKESEGTRRPIDRLTHLQTDEFELASAHIPDEHDIKPPEVVSHHQNQDQIPVQQIEQPRIIPAPPPPPTTNTNVPRKVTADSDGINILVVDDDLLTRRLMTRMLTRLGHFVTTAENGRQALDLIHASESLFPCSPRSGPGPGSGEGSRSPSPFSQPFPPTPSHSPLTQASLLPSPLPLSATPASYSDGSGETAQRPAKFDIVFLDNQMPILSGVECAFQVRSLGFESLICGITGNAMKEDQDEYIDAGADYVLIKPVMEGDVRMMIQRARERRNGARK